MEALLQTLRQMNLMGNGDRTITKLGETLTGVSINKPLIRKKEAERSRSRSTGGEYQWHAHICMQAQLSGEGPGLTGASPMVMAHPSIPDPPWRRACPLFDCAVNPAHPPPPAKSPSKCSLHLLHLFPFSALFSSLPLTSLSAQCPECAAVLCDFTVIDCGGGPPLPR